MAQQMLDEPVWGGAGVAHAFGRRWPSERHPRPVCGSRRYEYTALKPLGSKSRACLRCAKILGHGIPPAINERIEALNAELRTLHARARRGVMK